MHIHGNVLCIRVLHACVWRCMRQCQEVHLHTRRYKMQARAARAHEALYSAVTGCMRTRGAIRCRHGLHAHTRRYPMQTRAARAHEALYNADTSCTRTRGALVIISVGVSDFVALLQHGVAYIMHSALTTFGSVARRCETRSGRRLQRCIVSAYAYVSEVVWVMCFVRHGCVFGVVCKCISPLKTCASAFRTTCLSKMCLYGTSKHCAASTLHPQVYCCVLRGTGRHPSL